MMPVCMMLSNLWLEACSHDAVLFQTTSTSNKPSPISDKDRRTDGQAYSSRLTGDVFDTKKVTGLWLQQQHKCCIGMLAHGKKVSICSFFLFKQSNNAVEKQRAGGQGLFL